MIIEEVSQLFNSLDCNDRKFLSIFTKQEQVKQIEREKSRLQKSFRAQIAEMDKVIIEVKLSLAKTYKEYVEK